MQNEQSSETHKLGELNETLRAPHQATYSRRLSDRAPPDKDVAGAPSRNENVV